MPAGLERPESAIRTRVRRRRSDPPWGGDHVCDPDDGPADSGRRREAAKARPAAPRSKGVHIGGMNTRIVPAPRIPIASSKKAPGSGLRSAISPPTRDHTATTPSTAMNGALARKSAGSATATWHSGPPAAQTFVVPKKPRDNAPPSNCRASSAAGAAATADRANAALRIAS
jgi:hypothetical protein